MNIQKNLLYFSTNFTFLSLFTKKAFFTF